MRIMQKPCFPEISCNCTRHIIYKHMYVFAAGCSSMFLYMALSASLHCCCSVNTCILLAYKAGLMAGKLVSAGR